MKRRSNIASASLCAFSGRCSRGAWSSLLALSLRPAATLYVGAPTFCFCPCAVSFFCAFGYPAQFAQFAVALCEHLDSHIHHQCLRLGFWRNAFRARPDPMTVSVMVSKKTYCDPYVGRSLIALATTPLSADARETATSNTTQSPTGLLQPLESDGLLL